VKMFHAGVALGVVATSLLGCSGECIYPPCAMPMAVYVTVSSAVSGEPIDRATLQVDDAATTQPCPGRCAVDGGAGTYRLTISAPGFEAVQRTVTVSATEPVRCGCGGVHTEDLAVSLSPTTP
jgi:PEGA domain